MEYLVTWKINLSARHPKDAAIMALQIQRDPESIATVFEVKDQDGKIIQVDLEES
jgi:hypothetical protein